jgi:sortase B
MGNNGLTVRGRSFRTQTDYQAALRDEKKIEAFLRRYESGTAAEKEQLVRRLKEGGISFETLLGDDFIDEIEEKLKSTAPAQGAKKGRTKKEKTKKEKNSRKKDAQPKRLEDYDADMQRQIKYEMVQQEKKRRRLVLVCSLVACVCIGYVAFYYFMYEKNTAQYDRLSAIREEGSEEEATVHINYTKQEDKELVVLEKYQKLYSQNKSLIGWLKIDDTNIDYPVMQTVNNEYYLEHNYTQEYDRNGSIFLDKDCDITNPGANMIIYGHHMKSGKMFGNLDKYSSKSYYEEHPFIQFDTIYEEGTYQVMYVFRSRIYNEDEIVFKYYQFLDAATPEEFDSNMNEMAALALYDTGVTATYGDRLITLSTCDSSEEDGRFVVVAKKVN